MADAPAGPHRPGRLSRRQLLLGGAVAGAGAAAAVVGDQLLQGAAESGNDPGSTIEAAPLATLVPFHGEHQAGVTVAPQAWSTFLALDLLDSSDREGLRRLLRILSDDAARLTAGTSPLADSEPELATTAARLTVTFGFGPRLVARIATEAAVPEWLTSLPAFAIDRLEDRWSDGDLLLEVAADDALTVAHAARMLLKDARRFTVVRWRQDGFRRAAGLEPPGTTMRNLFGQLDGTVNPAPTATDFDGLVWITEGWLAGGTSYVIRRIRMDLDTWDELDRSGRELAVGRRLDNGAPLTGSEEHDEPDFEAVGAAGFPVIPAFSHLRRARSDDPRQRILRRSYNYELPPTAGDGTLSDSGLVFGSFQADLLGQFLPIQQRLAELDLLNQWTTPIGSAVFAVPPGCAEGGFIGETLFE